MTSLLSRPLLRAVGVPVLAFGVGSVLTAAGGYSDYEIAPPWTRYACLAVVCVGMMLRRRAPITGLLIGTVGFGVDAAVGATLATIAVYTDNLYSAALYGPKRTDRVLLILCSACTLAVGIGLYPEFGFTQAFQLAAVTAFILVTPIVTAMVVGEHRERAAVERDRAEKIAELAEVDRRATLTEERTRMARELHDTIANYFSAIAMQSSAVLSRSDMDSETVRDVMGAIRTDSVAGLAEMRRTIEFLRAEGATEDPVQHRLSDVDSLITRMRQAGLEIDLSIAEPVRDLPTAVEFAGYRILQEALTNALKHGERARVVIGRTADRLTITVHNDVPEAPAGVPGSGAGLIGMRERTTILGGQFTAGPHESGWRVTADLPISTQETA